MKGNSGKIFGKTRKAGKVVDSLSLSVICFISEMCSPLASN